jgi:recombination protein RecA
MSLELDDIIKKINKNFKQEIVSTGLEFEPCERIPFSSPRLNYLLYGGLPIGRLVEFSGDEGSGKTTTALDIVAHAQKLYPDKKVLWVDVERTLDGEWAEKLGVDVSNLIYLKPNEQSGEQILEATRQILSTDEISVCVFDSIGALVSAQAYSKSIEEKTFGGISAPLTLFSKEIIPICARSGCLFIGINQMRENMNNPYASSTTTGGRAWRHNCSVRMEFRKGDYLDEKGNHLSKSCENPSGHVIKVALIKSKICKMNRKIGYYTLNYLNGIDSISDYIDIGLLTGVITQSGAWYYFTVDEKEYKYNGRDKLKLGIAENEAIQKQLEEALMTE